MNKNYRIHTNIIEDSLLQVNMRQDFDFMEILSLKLSQKDAYKIHSSNYGVIIGRVLANDAFGIPNAKVSVFIERDENDTTELENIYPYSDVRDKDKNGIRYNLLPDYSDDECYRVVGTFPNKRLLLDDTTYIEVYDKYWKYSTVTNNAGDFMIFAVPVGSQQLHVDIDMSDIGVLSQKPRDYMYKGYTETLFDSSTQFKSSTNLDNLTQIFSQNQSVYVYPFWGDAENGIAAITRADVQINYKFEPTCVFMGSIVSDNDGNNIDHECGSTLHSGFNRQLVAGEGTIEMIRKTQDGLVEEYPIQGNRLIDSDGVWCYQIPMNLDYVGTDEYGNVVPTDNPKKGIPTRTQVRFRISKTETGGEGTSRHTAKYLVPMNPVLDETKTIPTTRETDGQELEKMYIFGSNTPQSCFRDLYWNNVYSVKNFIPKTQTSHRAVSPYYNALKACNVVDDQNPIPFNKIMINIPFTYMFICLLFTIVVAIINFVNNLINLLNEIIKTINSMLRVEVAGVTIFDLGQISYLGCVTMQAGSNAENKVYAPGCNQLGRDNTNCPKDIDNCKIVDDKEELMDVIQQNLSQEYDVVRLDLYQDWLNGCLYMPLWFWKKAKKKKFLFFTIKGAVNEFCNCNKSKYNRLKTWVTCNIVYKNDSLKTDSESVDSRESKWHKSRKASIWFKNGLIKPVENNDGLTAYYYVAYQPRRDNNQNIPDVKKSKNSFQLARLFATDIILLGNLNESNLYGIPQLFNNIPSTTSNIPPIATIEQATDDGAEENPENDLADAKADEGGRVITTGMDWGYSGSDDTPIYKKGLFLDLACLYADTKAKACINVERLSELGVSLDMSYKMEYGRGSDIVEGVIDSDGFVNKFELNDNDARAMFATLNHIGFIPQDYQTDKEMYETQVIDENTGYLVPKFKYTYPVDFDGRMQPIMDDYENGFTQPLFDTRDESYVTFRLGAESTGDFDVPGEHGRIRHFYYTNEGWEMPLYNNSFYFYFGINKGNTAMDKFYSKFIAPCTKDDIKPFNIDIRTQGNVECRCMYRIPEYRDPFIEVTMDDIQAPYYYELRDSNNNLVLLQTRQTATSFRIPDANNKHTSGVTIDNDVYTLKVTDANGKKVSERITVETPKVSVEYETQRLGTRFYDTNSTRVDYICSDDTMFYGKLRIKSFTIDGYQFYVNRITPIGYSENDNSYTVMLTGVNNLQDPVINDNGETVMENVFYNDSTQKDEECSAYHGNANNVIVTISTIEGKSSEASSATTNGVRNCMCDKKNPIAVKQGSASGIAIDTAINGTAGEIQWVGQEYFIPELSDTTYYRFKTDADAAAHAAGDLPVYNIAEFYVYQPNTFIITTTQCCIEPSEGETQSCTIVSANTTSEMAVIQNGENFNAYLNKMPVRFMLGTINDSTDGTIANKSNFYTTKWSKYVDDVSYDKLAISDALNGWFGVHQEDTYKFAPTDEKNRPIWEDFVTLKNGISTADAKKKILKYKFETMFSLSEATYVTSSSSLKFTYRAEGGTGIALNRTVAPVYDRSTLKNKTVSYTLSDRSTVTCDSSYPNIVGNNYKTENDNDDIDRNRKAGPYLNERFERYYKYQGNYFAVFSNNGGYINNKTIDKDIPVIKSPNYSLVTRYVNNNPEKEIGKDIKNKMITEFNYVYDSGTTNSIKHLPYLRTMFVDRRLDFNLQILAPSTGQNIRLYPLVDGELSPKEKVWKGGRISGTTYGGIEMSYDEEYNILSANTSDDFSSATANTALEYSYSCTSGGGQDAKTIFNENPQQYRRLYEAELNGADIRDYFWSDARKASITASLAGREIADGKVYFYKYPSNTAGLFNGDFSRNSIVRNKQNYPTKRYIDVGNLPMVGGTSNLLLSSCSYTTRPTLDTVTGELKMQAIRGESLNYEFSFSKPITMVSPNAENSTFGNVVYGKHSGTDWITFSADTVNLIFKLNQLNINGFNVYTQGPKILKVLPYPYGNIDGISYIKTLTNKGNESGDYNGKGTINKALHNRNKAIVLYHFHKVGERMYTTALGGIQIPSNDTITSESIKYKDKYYNTSGEEVLGWFLANKETNTFLDANSNEINNITFAKALSIDKDVKIFTIGIEREYESKTNDNLKKHISTFETSDLYDARPLVMKVDDDNTYVEMLTIGVESTTNSEGSTNPVEGADGNQEQTVVLSTTESKGQTHIQTFGFEFKFDLSAAPVNGQCEAFADYDTMSYSFIFTNAKKDSYTLYPFEVKQLESTNANDLLLGMKVKWTQDMGIMADEVWFANTNLVILGKTKDNFVYKIAGLKYKFNGFEDGVTYNTSTKTSEGMTAGKHYKTKTKLIS